MENETTLDLPARKYTTPATASVVGTWGAVASFFEISAWLPSNIMMSVMAFTLLNAIIAGFFTVSASILSTHEMKIVRRANLINSSIWKNSIALLKLSIHRSRWAAVIGILLLPFDLSTLGGSPFWKLATIGCFAGWSVAQVEAIFFVSMSLQDVSYLLLKSQEDPQ